jgi:hypothetical protein
MMQSIDAASNGFTLESNSFKLGQESQDVMTDDEGNEAEDERWQRLCPP